MSGMHKRLGRNMAGDGNDKALLDAALLDADWMDRQWPLSFAPVCDGAKSKWRACAACQKPLHDEQDRALQRVCGHCGHHARMCAKEWLAYLSNNGPLLPIAEDQRPVDLLGFADTKPYAHRLDEARQRAGATESLVCARGQMGAMSVVLACFEFAFIGGTLGAVAGERFAQAVEVAIAEGVPLVCVCASGGARMQEGVVALFQMAKIAQALARLAEHGLPYVSILTDPTTGGVAASLAMQADVIIAEKEALIGFTGPRVIAQTIKTKLPEGFQKAEALLAQGAVDRVLHRHAIVGVVQRVLQAMMAHRVSQPAKPQVYERKLKKDVPA